MALLSALSCSITYIGPVNILFDVRNDLLCAMNSRVKKCNFTVHTVIYKAELFPCMLKPMPRFRFKIIYHYSIDPSALCHLHTRNVDVSTGSTRKWQLRCTVRLHVTVSCHPNYLKLTSVFLTVIRPTN